MAIEPGKPGPDFALLSNDLTSAPGEKPNAPPRKLKDFRGKPLVVVFYPADWTPVCGDQLSIYSELLPEFERLGGAQVVAISCDTAWCHRAFAQARKVRFPLLSDFEPKGATARAWGVYREGDGLSERALFVLDGEGVVRWSYVSPMAVNPGADGILEALEELQRSQEGGRRHAAVEATHQSV
jgi:peroxiredoxin